MLARADVLGSLEHHVFEEMREPRAPFALIARAHVVVDDNREHGSRVVFGYDHAQAVRQPRVRELDFSDRCGGDAEHHDHARGT